MGRGMEAGLHLGDRVVQEGWNLYEEPRKTVARRMRMRDLASWS